MKHIAVFHENNTGELNGRKSHGFRYQSKRQLNVLGAHTRLILGCCFFYHYCNAKDGLGASTLQSNI